MNRLSLSRNSLALSISESDADDLFQRQMEDAVKELGSERGTSSSSSTSFLRMVTRGHITNASNRSISSLISLAGKHDVTTGDVLGRSNKRHKQMGNSNHNSKSSKTPLTLLYELLLQPLEDELAAFENHPQSSRKIAFVLPGDLIIVPFASLRASQTSPYLSERFYLSIAPSLISLEGVASLSSIGGASSQQIDCFGAVVAGSPCLPQGVMRRWQWGPLPAMESECRLVAELLACKSLTGEAATKQVVMESARHAEIIHLATHVSWRLCGIVLSSSSPSSAGPGISSSASRISSSGK